MLPLQALFNAVQDLSLTKEQSCINSIFPLPNQALVEDLHYIDRVPLNPLAAVHRRPIGRARKRRMESSKLTFTDLKKLLAKKIESGAGPSASSVPNLHSALKSFLEERGVAEDAPVGSILRASYYKNWQVHLQALRAEGRSADYARNRRTLLAIWRRLVIEHDQYCAVALEQATPFQRAVLDIFDNGLTVKGVAKGAGISDSTLRRWCAGNMPNQRSVQSVSRLERYLGLVPGQLTDLLPAHIVREPQVLPTPIRYRERVRELQQRPYAVTQPTPRLRTEWAEFLQYKVAELDCEDSEGEALKRSVRGRWSTSTTSGSAPRPSNWAQWYRGRYVATAGVAWNNCAQFFGWLMLPVEEGGVGLPAEAAQTLGHLVDRQYLRDFIDWKRQRADGVAHGGLVSFIRFVSSLVNPTTGYLTQRWKTFSKDLDASQEVWRARCKRTFDTLAKLRVELLDEAGLSRQPTEPIKHILLLPNPLDAIADMVIRMQSARPLTGGIREAVWARDILLIKLITSNPLRDKNLRTLTYSPDNTGHLRRDADGSWFIHVSRRELKNQNGAAKDRDYQMPVHKEVWPDIERYLRQYRPVLAGANTSTKALFLTERRGAAFTEDALLGRLHLLTRRYLHGCPGVGAHAFRYIVATSILKASPNDWVAASWALHDREETVRRHYAHLAKNDAVQWMGKAMDGPFSRM